MHIKIAKEESRSWTCTVTQNGATLDLSGCDVLFTVKRRHFDTTPLFQLNNATMGISFVNTTSGIYQLTIHSTATSSVTESGKNEAYVFDHRVRLANGGIKVLEEGDFIVTPKVGSF